jgi:hypothetical protein
VHQELKRKGVTLVLLWQEYKALTPDGLQEGVSQVWMLCECTIATLSDFTRDQHL